MYNALYPVNSFIGSIILGLVIFTRPSKKVFKEKRFQIDPEYIKKTYFPFLKEFANVAKNEKDIGGKLWIDQNSIGVKCRREFVYIVFTDDQSWYLESGSHRGFKTKVYNIPLTKLSFISALETIKTKKTFLQ